MYCFEKCFFLFLWKSLILNLSSRLSEGLDFYFIWFFWQLTQFRIFSASINVSIAKIAQSLLSETYNQRVHGFMHTPLPNGCGIKYAHVFPICLYNCRHHMPLMKSLVWKKSPGAASAACSGHIFPALSNLHNHSCANMIYHTKK